MINTNRWLDIAIFSVEKNKFIGKNEIQSGHQQLFRIGKYYYFAKLGQKPYVKISIKFNDAIIRTVFSQEVIDP